MSRIRAISPARQGFTFVEFAVGMVVLLASLLISSRAVGALAEQRTSQRETGLAVAAARNLLETLRSEPFDALFARYNSEPADDPGGAGSGPGSRFAVAGLDAAEDSPDGLTGELRFPTIVVPGVGQQLREDVECPELGMPRDLSGDNRVDDRDHSTSYFILPVQVRIRWRSASGVRAYEMATQLCEYVKP